MSAETHVGADRRALEPELLIENNVTLHDITNAVCAPVETEVAKTPIGWIISFVFALGMLGIFGATVATWCGRASGSGATTSRSAGRGTSPTSCGGSASATPGR